MHLIQILLPIADNNGMKFSSANYSGIQAELTKKFGGLTAFMRSPAIGLWEQDQETVNDDIVIFEVQTKELDRAWWGNYKKKLEKEFRQDEIMIRTQVITIL